MSFETARYQWEDGARRVQEAPPQERPALEHAVERVVADLRRRLGGPFTSEELTELYERGTDWVLDVAVAAEPEAPWAWDERTVADAAFQRYLREAMDFAGGRRLTE
jgi:hypothetical protein